jgi:hypothetical protein
VRRGPRTIAVLLLSATLAACSSGGGSPSSGGAPVVVKVAIRSGKVVPPTHRVQVGVGQKVHLEVTSDQADVLHIHGVNIEKPLVAGKTRTVVFSESQSGLFEVETHESNLQLLQLEVR